MSTLYIAAEYVAALVQYAEELSMSAGELLSAESMPTVLTGLVPWSVMEALIVSLNQKKLAPDLGLNFGLTLDINRHGLLGYAAKSSRTALEAILLDEQFMATRMNVIQFRIVHQQQQMSLHIDSPVLSRTDISRFLYLTVLGFLARTYSDLSHGRPLEATFVVPFPVIELAQTKNPLLAKVVWQEEPMAFRVDAATNLLLALLPTADETLKNLLVTQCKAAMLTTSALDSIEDMVRNLLRNQLVDPPCVGLLGQQLNLTERTLKRYLHQAGTSYRAILAELRAAAAINYLQTTDLTVDDIAYRLGYTSPSTFKNRFRHWTGKTPKDVRMGR